MADLVDIWRNAKIPVLFKRNKDLLVKLPYAEDNGPWLRGTGARTPKWDPLWKCWRIPKAWLDETLRRCAQRAGSAYLVQVVRREEKCSPACTNARGPECTCSCLGKNHGGKNADAWFHVKDADEVTYKGTTYSCRLIKAKPRQRS